MSDALNVLGTPLQLCCSSPLTGFYRTGYCETGPLDTGVHTVCAQVTGEFLQFSKQRGNDLTTPAPQYQFPGLKPGDRWCLCASRWEEARRSGMAPPVILAATHQKTLEIIPLAVLQEYSLSLLQPE